MDKINLDDFIKKDYDEDIIDKIPSDILESWHNRTIYSQLLDVWGEANRAFEMWKDFKAKKNKYQLKDIEDQLDNMNRLCNIIYHDNSVTDGMKYELKVAEWELYDFCLWNNIRKYNKNNIMSWFNQWCFDINPKLL